MFLGVLKWCSFVRKGLKFQSGVLGYGYLRENGRSPAFSGLKRSIVRAIDPLVNAGVLESYDFEWDKIRFVFSKVRQAKKSQVIPAGEKIRIDSITLKILETLGGIKSERLFRKIAQGVPEDVIYACLSQVKELQGEGKILESSVGYFVTLIGQECDKRGIKTPFKRKKNTLQQLAIVGKV